MINFEIGSLCAVLTSRPLISIPAAPRSGVDTESVSASTALYVCSNYIVQVTALERRFEIYPSKRGANFQFVTGRSPSCGPWVRAYLAHRLSPADPMVQLPSARFRLI
jgi:hypothetical protein